MRKSKNITEAETEWDVQVIAHVVALIHSRRCGDYVTAAAAHNELVSRGVQVRLPTRKRVARD